MSEVTTTNGHAPDGADELTKARTGPITREIGVSGISVNAGLVQADEFDVRLRGVRKVKAFREMQDNDPVIGAILYALQMLVRQVGWHTEQADGTDEGDPEAERWAEFLDQCLHDMSYTWPQTLTSILTFLPYGWSYHEIVYKRRGGDVEDSTRRSKYEDGLWGWRKFALRTQESCAGWQFDDAGGIQAMLQAQPNGATVPIPIDKSLLFRTSQARNDPEGRSVLRNAYVPWFRKKRIEEIEAIGIERDLAGLPIVRAPAEFLDPGASADKVMSVQAMKDIVANIRRNTQEGVVFPVAYDEQGNKLWDIELLTSGGRRQFDTDAIVARYAQQIAMTVLADFILLGHEKVGSYALGASKVELFTVALGAWIDEIASVMNEYAVPRLMKLNGVPRQLWPTLAHDEIAEVDLEALASFVESQVKVGVITPDEPLEQRMREVAQLPQADPDTADPGTEPLPDNVVPLEVDPVTEA